MIKGSGTFTFVDKVIKVTKDGEKYLCFDVLTEDNRKIGFITKDEDLINKLVSLNLTRFQDVKLYFNIDRVYNSETRFSSWAVQLVGVG